MEKTARSEHKKNELAALKAAIEYVEMFGIGTTWIDAESVYRNAKCIDVALNGERDAAPQAMLCDVTSQIEHIRRNVGAPLSFALGHPEDFFAIQFATRDEHGVVTLHGRLLPPVRNVGLTMKRGQRKPGAHPQWNCACWIEPQKPWSERRVALIAKLAKSSIYVRDVNKGSARFYSREQDDLRRLEREGVVYRERFRCARRGSMPGTLSVTSHSSWRLVTPPEEPVLPRAAEPYKHRRAAIAAMTHKGKPLRRRDRMAVQQGE